MGRLAYDAQKGMYLHPTLYITPERLPLGITDVWQWTRGKSKKEDQEKLWDAVDKQGALAKITFLKPRKKGEKSRGEVVDCVANNDQ